MCHGVGIGKGKEKFIQMVNFVGQRYMVEELLPRIADGGSVTFISSTGGYGWEHNMQHVGEVLACPTFEATEKWVDEHVDLFTDGQTPDLYQFSKQCVSAYVKEKTRAPEFIGRKIRINAIAPSFTSTALIKEFNLAASSDGTEAGGAQVLHNLFLKSWNGRAGLPEEMGYPLVFIGSDLFSYLSGQVLYIDYGMTDELDYQAAAAKGFLKKIL
jgi:NAD(P)-dependent dehydrogenase (short-subunit alcohol dehydrogenase family)